MARKAGELDLTRGKQFPSPVDLVARSGEAFWLSGVHLTGPSPSGDGDRDTGHRWLSLSVSNN